MLPRDVGAPVLCLTLLLLLATFDLSAATPPPDNVVGHYLNEFAVEVTGGAEVAEGIAQEHGFELVQQVSGLSDIYHFRHKAVSHRSKRSAKDVVQTLRDHPNVKYAEQQRVLGRYKRSPVNRNIVHGKQLEPLTMLEGRDTLDSNHEPEERKVTTKEMGIDFNDPQFPRMWYLINKGQTGGPEGYDVNVLPVWKKGITGKGVVVSILDDGIDHRHKDLAPNYDARASADFNDASDQFHDPMPEGNLEDNSHGTKCAGEVAAVANNNLDGLGIAYNANIGGVRMLDGMITDMMEGKALVHAKGYVDIYSASWGPSDDGKTMEEPGPLAKSALEEGVNTGRDGKGSLYVWATGNGGGNGDDCNCDGYVSSIYSISIGCINDRGLSTYFSEICPSTLAVIHTGGPHAMPDDPGYVNPPIKVITVDVGGDNDRFTDQFMGTSAAAPLAAGVFALVLEANPDLTWRDCQNIVVETAAVPNPDEPGWTINGGGYHINHRFGFGALDVGKMVEAAQRWVTVPEQRTCELAANNEEMGFAGGESKKQTLSTDGCGGHIDRLEHVQVHMDLDHSSRGDLSLTLTSPHGTSSQILSPREADHSSNGIRDWTFMTVHNWGEDPSGEWELEVRDTSDHSQNHGRLLSWSITLYGVDASNYHNKGVGVDSGAVSGDADKGRDHQEEADEGNADEGNADAHEADSKEVQDIMDKEQEDSDTVDIKKNTGGKADGKNAVVVEKEEDNAVDRETDEMLDALAALFRGDEMTRAKKKSFVEEVTMNDDREKQHVSLRNLQRRLEHERQREIKEEEERRAREELRELLGVLLQDLEA